MRALWRAVVWRKEGKAAAAVAMALSVSALSNSGHVPINLPVEGSGHSGQRLAEQLVVSKQTMNFEGLA